MLTIVVVILHLNLVVTLARRLIVDWRTLAGLGILCAWELLAALGCFALSRDVLHNCDMPSVKPQGK